MDTTFENIPVSQLVVNSENPRFEPVANEREAIKMLIEELGEKMHTIANHIVNSGSLNPLNNVGVIPIKDNRYLVEDGNRRVATIKILTNPNLVPPENESFLKKIRPLSAKFLQNPITEIRCAILPDKKSADPWTDLEHTGENEGAGQVRWNSVQTERHRVNVKRKGKPNLALQVIEFLQKSPEVTDELKKKLPQIHSTNLQRLLSDKNVQKFCGYEVNEGQIRSDLPPEELIKPLIKMATDVSEKKIVVGDIYNSKDRQKYLLTFKKNDISDKKKTTGKPWIINSFNSKKSPKTTKRPKASDNSPIIRDTLVPKDFALPINDSRNEKIFNELRSLNADDHPNAAAVLFRVFVELSIDAFIKEKKIQGVKQMTSLKEKVEKVIAYLKSSNLMNQHIWQRLELDVKNKNSVLSIEGFNGYVHNRHYTPKSSDLKTDWDDISYFMSEIWSQIK